MAGAIVPVAINQVTEQRKGFQNITLTNWTNTAEPAINQGGRVEIKGALFSFAGNEDLDASNNWAGFGNSTQIYGYYLVGGGGTTVVCELTTTAPTWQEESGGWYDTASDTNRFWGGIYKDSGGNYSDKFLYLGRELAYSNNFNIDERGAIARGRIVTGVYEASSPTENQIFDALSPSLDTIGREIIVSGGANVKTGNFATSGHVINFIFTSALRFDASTIRIKYTNVQFDYSSNVVTNILIGAASISINNGDGTVNFTNIKISW